MDVGVEKRRFPRMDVTGQVKVSGQVFALCNLGPGGGALVGHDVWWEDDVVAEVTIPCNGHVFLLRRILRTCYMDPLRGVVGFEFVGATSDQIDIVLGLMLAGSPNHAQPLALSQANQRALAELWRHGRVDCTEGAWSAREPPQASTSSPICHFAGGGDNTDN